MIGRYTILRGAPKASFPAGVRQDTRKHTQHFLAPTPEMVAAVFGARGSARAWGSYAEAYRALLESRYAADPKRFALLATMSKWHDVWLGCSCPSSKNPDVGRCHTILALRFLKQRFPEIDVVLPPGVPLVAET